MTKHTPTPWIAKEGLGLGSKYYVGETVDGKNTPFQSTNKTNAAFIVKAVNCHEDLLRVCKMIYDFGNEQDKFAEPWMLELGEVIDKAEGK